MARRPEGPLTPANRSGGAGPPQIERRRRRGLGSLLAAVVLAELAFCAAVFLASRGASRLPRLPSEDRLTSAMADHLRRADAVARSAPGSAEAVGGLGMAYHSDGFPEEAMRCYELARELAPRDWRWPYYEVLLGDEAGESGSRADALREVVALNPGWAPAWFLLGQAELKRGKDGAAEEAFRKAMDADRRAPAVDGEPGSRSFPVAAYARWGIGQVYLRRGENEKARDLLLELTGAHPDFGPAHRSLGAALERLGREDEAELRLRRAASLAPYVPPPDPMIDALARASANGAFLLRNMGIAAKSSNFAWAERLGQRAIAVAGDDPDAWFQLGQLYYQARRWSEALPCLKRFCEMSTDRDMVLRVLNNVGAALIWTGKPLEAVECLERALPDNPRPGGVHLNIALALLEAGKLDDARDHLDQAIRLEPGYAEAHATLGRLLVRMGKTGEAKRAYEEATRLRPGYADAWAGLADLAASEGKYEEAALHYRAALDAAPEVASHQTGLAWILAACPDATVRNGAEAVRLAERACALTRNADVDALDALAAAHAETGDFRRAVTAVDRAILLAATRGPAALDALRARRALYESGRPYRGGSRR